MPTELRPAHTRGRELNLKVLTAGRCRARISQTLPLSSTSKKPMLVIETAVVKSISPPQLGQQYCILVLVIVTLSGRISFALPYILTAGSGFWHIKLTEFTSPNTAWCGNFVLQVFSFILCCMEQRYPKAILLGTCRLQTAPEVTGQKGKQWQNHFISFQSLLERLKQCYLKPPEHLYIRWKRRM